MSVFEKMFAGGAGCSISGFITNPCDVIKIRNQLYGNPTFFGTARSIINGPEGPGGLLKGVKATVMRESTYSSVRMGLYEPIKFGVSQFYLTSFYAAPAGGVKKSDAEIIKEVSAKPFVKWGSAFCSGAIGSAMFNPIDLVKVRFQSAQGDTPSGGSVFRDLSNIVKEKGVGGLYSGVTATVIRAAMLTSAQLGTYDVVKNNLLVENMGLKKENNSTHFAASLITSVVATTVANPPDVIKTRVMNDLDRKIGGPGAHFMNVLKNEGPGAFFKGWTASYFRLGPHTILSFVLIEQVRQMIGLGTM